MPEPDAGTEQKKYAMKDLPHRKAQNFQSVYTNTAGFGVGFFDLQIIFGHVVPGHSKDESFEPHIEDTVSVTMSWEHAKALAIGLNKTIEGYETDHGKIRLAE